MRICIVNPFYDREIVSGTELISRYRHLAEIARALGKRGHRVFIVQAFHTELTIETDWTIYKFVSMPHRGTLRLSGAFPSGRHAYDRLIAAVAGTQPDVVHMNGLTHLLPLAALGSWCAANNRLLTVSHHGGRLLNLPWLRPWQRWVLSNVHRVFATSPLHVEPWVSEHLLRPDQVIGCMEVSSPFTPQPRDISRARTGMHGSPIFAWNGRLHPVKDPLTALKGFSLIRRQWTEARLYMIYLTDELRGDVEHAIASDPNLRDSVELRGCLAHAAVEDFLNSSDFLLLSSVREGGTTYAVVEAMACGVIPVLTDIPSFRAMTDNGKHGLLFPFGDAAAMAARVLAFDRYQIGEKSQEVRDFFARSLSYDTIATTYEAAFLPAQQRPHLAIAEMTQKSR
jgi:glycosyltransferase involved in cell wall biosynthesis